MKNCAKAATSRKRWPKVILARSDGRRYSTSVIIVAGFSILAPLLPARMVHFGLLTVRCTLLAPLANLYVILPALLVRLGFTAFGLAHPTVTTEVENPRLFW
ncbi:MAG: hypothetical protein U5O39_00655 [Gammaproteobacteria bacterium]|nr:hypothetical protein [Gammaproteobacteria bacterium]